MTRVIPFLALVAVTGLGGSSVPAAASATKGHVFVVARYCPDRVVEVWTDIDALPRDGCLRRVRALLRLDARVANQFAPNIAAAASSPIRRRPFWPRLLPNFSARTVAMASLGGSGLATVVQDVDGTVHAFTPNNQPLPGWPARVGPASASTMAGAADLNGNGLDEVLVAVGSLNVLSADGQMAVGWPFQVESGGFQGKMPIAARFPSADLPRVVGGNGLGSIFLFDTEANVLPGWPVFFPKGQFPHPLLKNVAVGDITGDGNPDIVATDFAVSRVFAYEQDGDLIPPFPVTIGGNIDEPTLGDLDGDGDHEIVLWTNPSPVVKLTKQIPSYRETPSAVPNQRIPSGS